MFNNNLLPKIKPNTSIETMSTITHSYLSNLSTGVSIIVDVVIDSTDGFKDLNSCYSMAKTILVDDFSRKPVEFSGATYMWRTHKGKTMFKTLLTLPQKDYENFTRSMVFADVRIEEHDSEKEMTIKFNLFENVH